MCIIVVKEKNTKKVDWNLLENCFYQNNDGAGFMFANGQEVVIKKGFTDFETFKKAVTPYNKKGIALTMHFRIRTHGQKNKAMCHPFPLTSKVKKLKKLETSASVGVAHNGMLTWVDDDKELSDTALFIKNYLSFFPQGFQHANTFTPMIDELLGGDRLAIMDASGGIVRYGEWSEFKGVYYSNESYKQEKRVVYNYDLYDDWDHWSYFPSLAKKEEMTTATEYDMGYLDGYNDCLEDMALSDGSESVYNPYTDSMETIAK